MKIEFPSAVPELPVEDVDKAAAYYITRFGFKLDWGAEDGVGISGVSKGHCRIFLANRSFREGYGNAGPVVVWINLNSKEEVNALHEEWRESEAKIISAPESKPWRLHEFTAADLDGNFLRVFYDFSRDLVVDT